MSDPIICLQCGGLVDPDGPLEPGQSPCSCSHPPAEATTVSCASCGGPLHVGARACPWCRSTVATCRCPACTAWNVAGALHCQACGRELTEHDDAAVRTELACPRCQTHLHARKYAELDVDECDSCGGLFLAPTMLDRIVHEHDRPTGVRLALPRRKRRNETEVQYVRCPRCDVTMNRRMFGRISGVVVDICRDHGVWFDGGELDAVVDWIEKGGLELARKRELDEVAEQVRSLRAEQVRMQTQGMSNPGMNDMPSLGTLQSFGTEFVDVLADLWSSIKK